MKKLLVRQLLNYCDNSAEDTIIERVTHYAGNKPSKIETFDEEDPKTGELEVMSFYCDLIGKLHIRVY